MPEDILPTTPPRKPFPVVGALIGLIVLIVVAGVVWYMQSGSLFGLSPRGVSGTVVLYVPTPWETPDRKTISGLVSYASGMASELIPAEILQGKFPVSISPSGKQVLAVSIPNLPKQRIDGVDGLVVISTDNALDQKLLLSTDMLGESRVVSVAWTPNDKFVAVGIVSGADESLEVETTVFNLESGQSLSMGSGVPVMFSPAQTQLLVADDGVFSFRTPDGESSPVSGVHVGEQPQYAMVSADGSYFSLYFSDDAQGSVHVYRTEWANSSVTELGVLGQIAKQGFAFGPEGSMLVFDGQAFGIVEDVGSGFAPKKSAKLPTFSENAVLIGWYGFNN